jgi:hypothetical protein
MFAQLLEGVVPRATPEFPTKAGQRLLRQKAICWNEGEPTMSAALIISSLIIQLACIAIFAARRSNAPSHEQLDLPLFPNPPTGRRIDSVEFWSRDSLPRGRTRLYGALVPVASFLAHRREGTPAPKGPEEAFCD